MRLGIFSHFTASLPHIGCSQNHDFGFGFVAVFMYSIIREEGMLMEQVEGLLLEVIRKSRSPSRSS